MSRLKFTAEGFPTVKSSDLILLENGVFVSTSQLIQVCIESAQAIYDKHVEALPKVFRGSLSGSGHWVELESATNKIIHVTHTARLEAIEELKTDSVNGSTSDSKSESSGSNPDRSEEMK